MLVKIDVGKLLFQFISYVIVFFLLFPIMIIALVSFNSSGFTLPPSGVTLRWFKIALTYEGFIRGMYVSFIVALISSVIATFLGTLSSLALIRYRFIGRNLINLFFMSPLMIPVVIMGIAFYIFLIKLGVVEGLFALIIGHTIMIMPFPIRTVSASLHNFDRALEEAAMNAGARPVKIFFSITLPIIKVGIIAGLMMSFILSWNNFALSVFISSADWLPLPIELYSYIQFEFDPSGAALAMFLVSISGIAIYVLDRLVGLGTVIGGQRENA